MTNDRLHVAVDLDDVILDFMGGVQHAVRTEYGVDVPDFTKWEMHEVLDPIIGKSWWKWMRERDWLWPNFPAMPGAIGALTTLRDEGHYLEIVTSKPKWAEYATWKWLGKWRTPVQRVTIVDMDTRKVDVTDADLLIDDKPENVQGFAADMRLGILFDRPHNKSFPDGHTFIERAHGWPDVLRLIREEQEDLAQFMAE